jgi:hypothetical protein
MLLMLIARYTFEIGAVEVFVYFTVTVCITSAIGWSAQVMASPPGAFSGGVAEMSVIAESGKPAAPLGKAALKPKHRQSAIAKSLRTNADRVFFFMVSS